MGTRRCGSGGVRGANRARAFAWLTIGAVLVPFAGMAGGCGTSASDVCDLKCDCQGCTEDERDDCIGDIESTVTLAEDRGCSDEYADWLGCVEREAECRNGEEFAWDGCDIEEDALVTCGGGSDPCAAAAKKLCNECNFSCADPDPAMCTGTYACESQCRLSASCAEIASPTPGGAYSTCRSECFL